MPQALSGERRSIPKLCRINGDDNRMIIYKNLGNNHAYPFIWGDEFTIASGTYEVTIASGIKFHGYDLASYGNITVTPLASDNVGRWYIDKDKTNNIVKLKCTGTAPDVGLKFDVKCMLGVDADVEELYCRGTGKGMPSLP